jgi:hypothetical protein
MSNLILKEFVEEGVHSGTKEISKQKLFREIAIYLPCGFLFCLLCGTLEAIFFRHVENWSLIAGELIFTTATLCVCNYISGKGSFNIFAYVFLSILPFRFTQMHSNPKFYYLESSLQSPYQK